MDLSGDKLDARDYDQCNGENAARAAIDLAMRTGNEAQPKPREVVCDDPANDEPLTDEQRKAVEAYWRARIFDPSDYRK